jgi:hypothetical protein
MFIRNLRRSKRVWGCSSLSRVSVDDVRRANGNRRLHPKRGKQCRPEFLRDHGISIATGIGSFNIRMVKSSGADCLKETLRLKYADRTLSTSPESLGAVAGVVGI